MTARSRASIVCTYNNSVLVFKGVDPHSLQKYWFLPGGKIEKNESPWACAEREAFEETGYRLQALKESEIIKNYSHWWNNVLYDCQTFFYKGVLKDPWHEPKPVVDVDYNKGATWISLDLALESFAYTKEIRDAVEALVK